MPPEVAFSKPEMSGTTVANGPSSPRYPCPAGTESNSYNDLRSAKPSNPGPSSGSSGSNGRRFKVPGIPACGVISPPVAPHTATVVLALEERSDDLTLEAPLELP